MDKIAASTDSSTQQISGGRERVSSQFLRGLATGATVLRRPGVLAIEPDFSPGVEQAPARGRHRGQPRSDGRHRRHLGITFSPWVHRRRLSPPLSPSRTATGSMSASLGSIAGTATPRSRFLSVANLPPTQTCMNCHQTVKRDSALLAPIRDSAQSGRPMHWIRVHNLPDYAYFAHNAHVAAGIGCVTCHGRIDEMETVTQMTPLSMSWCLDCHRNPGPQETARLGGYQHEVDASAGR